MDQECVERQQSAQNEAGRREKLTFKASRETGYWDDKDNKHWDSADSQSDMAIGKLGNGPIMPYQPKWRCENFRASWFI
jgi:hypothetical protein